MAIKKGSLSELENLEVDFTITEEMVDQSFSQLDQVLRSKGFPEEVLSSKKSSEDKDLIA